MRKFFILLGFFLCLSCSEQAQKTKQENVVQVELVQPVQPVLTPTRLTFRYEISNPNNQQLNNVSVLIAIPSALSNRHTLSHLDINAYYEIVADEIGNQTALIVFDAFSPYATKLVTMNAHLTPKQIAEQPIANSIKPAVETELVPFLNDYIQAIAKPFKGLPKKEIISKSYNWVVNNLEYAGYIPDDRAALYALRKKRGDCTEYMYLLAALLRANVIPSRLVAGYVYTQSQLAHASDYHNWVEVLVDGQWLVVDAQKERLFGDHSDYISVRYLDSPDPLIQKSQRFLVSEKLKVKMY